MGNLMDSTLSTTTGFHTTWTTTAKVTRDGDCSIYILYDLPPHVFVDSYELANYRDSYTFQLSVISNLELPVTALLSPGSSLLLNVSLGSKSDPVVKVDIDVPLHLRYGKPASFDYHHERIPSPTAYIACPGDVTSTSRRPDVPTQFLSYFDSHSVTVVSSHAVDSHSVVRIPVGRLEHLPVVEIGTTGIILFAFILILRASLRVATRLTRAEKQSKSD